MKNANINTKIMPERFSFEGQGENHNEMREIAGEAYQTTEDVFRYLEGRVAEIDDPEIRKSVEDNLRQWNGGAREAFGLFLQNLTELRQNPDRWKQIAELAEERKEVPLEDQQKVVLALLANDYDPKRASQQFQWISKDLKVPGNVIFRGRLEEQR